ncbi:MAG: DUF1211 domain-containing protein [Bacteroidetes bacterium]|nr:DUF1211 domain-containing protein [Bacteroidota bacterium]
MENSQHTHQEHRRTQFQIDRIAFFSDAVIAIAITLMILEIKIPPLGQKISLKELLTTYGGHAYSSLLALLICYISIGNLWMRHHELYEHIINYNKRLIRVNLFFLFSIMMLPVSTSFMFEWNNPPQIKMVVFFINLFFCNLTYYLMLLVVFNNKINFSSITGTEAAAKTKMIAFNVTLMFLLVIVLTIFWPQFFFVPFIVWPLVSRIAERVRKSRSRRNIQAEK